MPKIKKNCLCCGKEFEVYPSKSDHKFCSKKCSRTKAHHPNWRGGKVERKCKLCGKVFFADRGEIKKGHAIFCSKKCVGQWKSIHYSGENSWRWKGGEITKICPQCGGKFQTARAVNNTCCSNRCAGKHKKGRYAGKNSQFWRGGLSFEPYDPGFTRAFKKRIRRRDSYTCAICGKLARNVHHIDYDKKNSTPENCIILCNSCHSITNTKRAFWQRTLEARMI